MDGGRRIKIISDLGNGLDGASQRSEEPAWVSLTNSFLTQIRSLYHLRAELLCHAGERNFVPELGLTDSVEAGHGPRVCLRCHEKMEAFSNKSEFTNALRKV